MEEQKPPQESVYNINVRLLGNEVFGISMSTTSTSNRLTLIAIVSIFSILTVLGAYGEKIVSLYHSLVS